MYVRTIVDVPHGAQLTVCHASQWDARPVRQAALLQVRAGGWGSAGDACALPLHAAPRPLSFVVWPLRDRACLIIPLCLTLMLNKPAAPLGPLLPCRCLLLAAGARPEVRMRALL